MNYSIIRWLVGWVLCIEAAFLLIPLGLNFVYGEPYAVDVKYEDGTGVCVAVYDAAADFCACADGTEDAAPAIQKALLQASKLGGGVVYIPEGVYLCENALEIPSGVTLRGEWVSPDAAPAGSCGTVLLVKSASRGRESGTPFIKLRHGAGLRQVPGRRPGAGRGQLYRHEHHHRRVLERLPGQPELERAPLFEERLYFGLQQRHHG